MTTDNADLCTLNNVVNLVIVGPTSIPNYKQMKQLRNFQRARLEIRIAYVKLRDIFREPEVHARIILKWIPKQHDTPIQ